MKSLLQKLAVCLLLFVPIMFCQNSPFPNGVHQHDGFFLRFTPGFGYSSLSETLPDDMLPSQFQGKDFLNLSGGFSIANRIQIGGTISDNLIIFGESGGAFMLQPSMEVLGESVEYEGDVWVYMGGFGPGVTYYIMPSNIYFSASILASLAMLSIDGETGESEIGFGFNVLVGKEWWSGEQWGLGVAVYGFYSSMNDKDSEDLTISNYSFGVLFSATFN